MKDKQQFQFFLRRVTYSCDTYILKIRLELSKLQAVEAHMHHLHATSQGIFPPIYDVVSADYDGSPSCRVFHGTAYLLMPSLYVNLCK